MATLHVSLLLRRIFFPFTSHSQSLNQKHRFQWLSPSSLQFHPCFLSSISCNGASSSIRSDTLTSTEETNAVDDAATVALSSDPLEPAERERVCGGIGRLLVVVFVVGLWNLWTKMRERFKIAFNGFMNWLLLWQEEEKCLGSLIDDAKENLNDSAKQTSPLVEPNLHSAESVIKHFKERGSAVDCRGVVEYLRALVTTNAIAEYLPDKESGKPCSLHTLLQELKQCASCNSDKTILSPGISVKQPLRGVKNFKTFKDVKGCDDAKQELEVVVEYLRNPAKFTRLGVKLPKGVLLTGPPGTGKTLLAKAFAGEAGVSLVYNVGPEFEETYVGAGAGLVKSIFHLARQKAPCVIFIDEIDFIGSKRKDYTNKALHQLLVEMDWLEQNEGIIVMAATSVPHILDPALTRSGRFDQHIVVVNPDLRGRQEILELYLQDKPLADDVDIKSIACGTPGFNGAELANLVNIAATQAAVEGAEKLAAAQLEFGKDRIMMGTERKTMFISEESKKVIAYHESGHAFVAINTVGANPLYKITIRQHGSSLGMVTEFPSSDEQSMSKQQLLARLDVCMGGRVAEEIVFGQEHITVGASSDLHTATITAKYMVKRCGMSDAIGPVYIQDPPSYEMQSRIDAEVAKLLREAYDRVKALLKKHEKALHALADALLFYGTLNEEEIRRILLPYQQVQQKREATKFNHLFEKQQKREATSTG